MAPYLAEMDPASLNLLQIFGLLIGGLALFLLGLEFMTGGLKAIAGSRLQALQFVSSRAMAEAREECVGRYELTIPDDADIALTIPAAFSKPQQNPIRFSNDQPAVHSSSYGARGFQCTD